MKFFLIILTIFAFFSSEEAVAKGKFRSLFRPKKSSTTIALIPRSACGAFDHHLVFEEKSKIILSQQKADEKIYPASLVKVMTLYLTFEALELGKINLDQEITISAYGEEISEVNKVNSLKLKEGNKISVRKAIEAVIVKSINEAAVALAEIVGKDEWNFVRMMNKKALELGMISTAFHNSTGLFAEGQYSNALDLAKLSYAIKRDFPQFYKFFQLKEFEFRDKHYLSHNRVLLGFKGAEGMKTGFIRASGFNLISSAKRDEKRIFAVLIGCESGTKRDSFMTHLLENGFYQLNQLAESGADNNKINKLFFD